MGDIYTFNACNTKPIHDILRQPERDFLWRFQRFTLPHHKTLARIKLKITRLLEKTVKINMNNVSSIVIKQYIFTMPIPKAKNPPNHRHDRRGSSIRQTTGQPSSGFGKGFDEPVVENWWEPTTH